MVLSHVKVNERLRLSQARAAETDGMRWPCATRDDGDSQGKCERMSGAGKGQDARPGAGGCAHTIRADGYDGRQDGRAGGQIARCMYSFHLTCMKIVDVDGQAGRQTDRQRDRQMGCVDMGVGVGMYARGRAWMCCRRRREAS